MAASDRSRRRRTVKKRKASQARRRKVGAGPAAGGEVTPALEERMTYTDVTPELTGGDVDADWQRATSAGEEAVGGSVATPDQDVVDELGRALGVEQAPDAQVRTSEEILRHRDRRYWEGERRAAGDEA